MPKPPPSPPSSDLEGVHQDERRNTDVAAERGESAEHVAAAKRKSKGRPPASDPAPPRDNPYSE